MLLLIQLHHGRLPSTQFFRGIFILGKLAGVYAIPTNLYLAKLPVLLHFGRTYFFQKLGLGVFESLKL